MTAERQIFLLQALFDLSKRRYSVGLGANKIFDPEKRTAYPREGSETLLMTDWDKVRIVLAESCVMYLDTLAQNK